MCQHLLLREQAAEAQRKDTMLLERMERDSGEGLLLPFNEWKSGLNDR